jgi:hypothetical protein
MSHRPDPAKLSPSARRLLDALSVRTSLAWPILKAQCEIAGRDPRAVKPEDLADLAPRIRAALSRFTTPQKAEAFVTEVMGQAPVPAPPPVASGREPPARGLRRQVLEVLHSHTSLGEPILETQCERARIAPDELGPSELRTVLPELIRALARFSSPAHAESARGALLALTQEP